MSSMALVAGVQMPPSLIPWDILFVVTADTALWGFIDFITSFIFGAPSHLQVTFPYLLVLKTHG